MPRVFVSCALQRHARSRLVSTTTNCLCATGLHNAQFASAVFQPLLPQYPITQMQSFAYTMHRVGCALPSDRSAVDCLPSPFCKYTSAVQTGATRPSCACQQDEHVQTDRLLGKCACATVTPMTFCRSPVGSSSLSAFVIRDLLMIFT
jgi:hypothetical protein